MFDAGSNAGHTPHPASRGVSPQAMSELQVRRDLDKNLLTLFFCAGRNIPVDGSYQNAPGTVAFEGQVD